jgi:polar amino acid transport system substrate-binding protein
MRHFAAMVWLMLAGCASVPADVRDTLAPGGKLRAGYYLGGPSSAVRDAGTGELKGVGYDLGRELARSLGVPFEPVIFPRNAEVIDALKAGRVDVAFTNATPERAKDIDFSAPYLRIELGYLVPAGSGISSVDEVDRPAVRLGVLQGGTSDAVLSRTLKNARLVRARSVQDGVALLRAGELDAIATQKSTLFEMSDQLPGSRVLDGGWGFEHHAIGIPKGRERGLPYLREFAEQSVTTGRVQAAAARAGLRGAR